MTEEEAFEGLRKGDPEALKFVYFQNKDICTNWTLGNLEMEGTSGRMERITKDQALGIYHDGIIILVENIREERLVNLRVRFSTYLIAVIQNLWRSQQRKTARERNLENLTDDSKPDVEAMQKRVRYAISQLNETCREMLTLRYFMEFPFDDIATVLDYKNGSVIRNLISRCRSRFRELYLGLSLREER